ncbi:helix-turn-helix domain-containing protein [Alkalibacter mobilis]|uniref:helix-turn-helix domain-containing protein n=1 Tax=Alkalibacter mobilis TaxID=2787712 RepID=UPI00189D7A91|nr:helix-turn-helix transcriptional regulator [Alkalibacter mobilis]MBF7097609.1 helix-turn-helix transcriptional regulator [Alkalibacter mobilis]
MLSERLKQIRKSKGFTQKSVSDSLQMDRSNLANYETGKAKPSFEKLEQLADLYEVSVDYLLGRTDDPTPYKDVNADLDAERDLDDELKKLLKDEELAAFYDFANMDDATKKEIIAFIRFKKGQE